ncbi:MAG: ATP-binding protein [Eisenbergiella sp.]
MKFTDVGGSITLHIHPVKEEDTGLALRFSLADTGIGISPEVLPSIFNAFEQGAKNISLTIWRYRPWACHLQPAGTDDGRRSGCKK